MSIEAIFVANGFLRFECSDPEVANYLSEQFRKSFAAGPLNMGMNNYVCTARLSTGRAIDLYGEVALDHIFLCHPGDVDGGPSHEMFLEDPVPGRLKEILWFLSEYGMEERVADKNDSSLDMVPD